MKSSVAPPPGQRLGALLAAWVMMIFGTSALVAYFGLSPRQNARGGGFLSSVWGIADEMGPAVKLLLIVVFAAAVTLGGRVGAGTTARRYAINTGLGVCAMLFTLLIIPARLSRGFGVGLTGARLDPAVLPVYIAGAVLGAIVYTRSMTSPGTTAR
ncbi:hypothetical protein [Longimicrobium terrae]|uniref:Uncharacterized protein n=1 Tax=Longimicrobium terrae TaxID=1639882 RepID=A0A841H0P5_9BACT|nr:hypothetical protein [Longimicrobium terrae]MBB4637213.1 hypothetical protein [Longimicrobium terrae]MBB6071526.1 hypothetical protein [Longimicrobium terrae]NNC30053.1 hypothetical protein [Longimicrobium terrae]